MYSRLRIRPGRELRASPEERRRIIDEQVDSVLARTRWIRGVRAANTAPEGSSMPHHRQVIPINEPDQ